MKKTTFDNFEEIKERIERFEHKLLHNKKSGKFKGTVYTPEIICRYISLRSIEFYLNSILKQQGIFTFLDFIKDLIKDLNFNSLKLLLKENNNLKKVLNKSIKSIRILDPACGTGRFLISIASILFQLLKILNPSEDQFKIKKSIIEYNLFGIDLDIQAVELCKLRLLNWSNSKIKNFKQDLIKNNIILGNFLIGDNFLELKKFDIILGNPPYIENKKMKSLLNKQILKQKYESAYKLYDISILFIERAYQLLRNKGYCSFIITNKFLSSDYGIKIRNLLINKTKILEIIDVSSLNIFKNASIYPIILSFLKSKNLPNSEHAISIKNTHQLEDVETLLFKGEFKKKIIQAKISQIPSLVFPIEGDFNIINYLLNNFKPLEEIYKYSKFIYRPFAFTNWALFLDFVNKKRHNEKDLILIGTSNIGKFHIKFNKKIKIANRTLNMSYFPYKKRFEKIWSKVQGSKLIFKEVAKDMTVVYDPGYFINITGAYLFLGEALSAEELLSISVVMNSNCVNYIFKSLFGTLHMASGYLRFNGSFLKRIPIPSIIPPIFSKLGKILHFLQQLIYEKEQNRNPNQLQQKTLNIVSQFFINLTDCLVYCLYFSKKLQKDNVNCSEIIRILKSKNIFPEINDIYPYRNLNSFNFRKEVPLESNSILNQIIDVHKTYSSFKILKNEMKAIKRHKWIRLIENIKENS